MCYQTQMPFIFVILFSDIGQYFQSAQTNSPENQKSYPDRIILDKIRYFLSFYISWCRLQTNYRRLRQTEFLNYRQIDTSYFCQTIYIYIYIYIYNPLGFRTFISGSPKKSAFFLSLFYLRLNTAENNSLCMSKKST